MAEVIVGIDLGTTNSEIAAFIDGKPQIIGNGNQTMLPSCIGMSPTGELLVGVPARNQMLLYPERTVRSVKRLMGTEERITLGDRSFSPAEISAFILSELARWAALRLGEPITKAVITVPAYFSDAQRNATREAGALAGLEVVRIVNEPTAASLAYGLDVQSARKVMVFDLGGGTLDVSIVRIDGEITEVLSSHGNNRLGGDDFDQKIVDHLVELFRQQHHVDVRQDHPAAYARLWWAAEEAKKQLSFEPFARIKEEALAIVDGKPLHMDVEISRPQYEDMIRPLVEQTLESASKALADANMQAADLDSVLLVGGSTRTPLVINMLERATGKAPRTDVHPDLCVALGAGVLASRIGGHAIERVLIDVSPFSFGPSYVGMLENEPYLHCYHPIIRRNTPLPVTRTDQYFTMYPDQTEVELNIYQGDDPDALKNAHVGKFRVEGLTTGKENNAVLCRMRLDLDGILHVTAIEKSTGMSKHIAITGATRPRDAAEIARGREEIERIFANRWEEVPAEDADDIEDDEFNADAPGEGEHEMIDAQGVSDGADPGVDPVEAIHTDETGARSSAHEPIPAASGNFGEANAASAGTTQAPTATVARCRQLMPAMHSDDQEEALSLIEDLEAAVAEEKLADITAATKALEEFLFFVEGR